MEFGGKEIFNHSKRLILKHLGKAEVGLLKLYYSSESISYETSGCSVIKHAQSRNTN